MPGTSPTLRGRMSLSAIMTVHNDAENIKKFFESFLNQTIEAKRIEFVIVDAGSTDGTIDIIKEYQKRLPRLKLIVKKSNRSEGRNLAIKQTSGRYVLTFNSDVSLREDCIERLIEALERHPKAGGMAAIQIYPESQNFFAKCVYHIPGMAQVSLVTTPSLREKELVETHSVPCECGVWRRGALPAGLFDERLNWGEDSELHSRMRKVGWKFYGTKKAEFEHFYKSNVGRFWRQQIGYGAGAATLWRAKKKLDFWGLSWKRYLALLAPFAFVFWLVVLFWHPWMGLVLAIIASSPLLKPAVTASLLERNSKFLAGVFFAQIVKYVANVVGFWRAIIRKPSP